MIGILDMQMGNLRSVWNALYEFGFDPVTVEGAKEFDDLTHLIIPGVGHFGAAHRYLTDAGLVESIRAFAVSGRPVLGICLGMHILAANGTEGGDTTGLNLIPGTVRRLPEGQDIRLPHVGWNTVTIRREHPVFEGLKPNRDFYFVHSYALACDRAESLLAETDYGEPFVSVAGTGNVVGFQFHPEKSQRNGMVLLGNFCNWDGRC